MSRCQSSTGSLDYSTAEVRQLQNFYRLAVSVSEILRKCERLLTT